MAFYLYYYYIAKNIILSKYYTMKIFISGYCNIYPERLEDWIQDSFYNLVIKNECYSK